MLKIVCIAFLIAVISVSQTDSSILRCPNVETVKSFKTKDYMGKWYQIEASLLHSTFGQKCITAEYKLNTNKTITVVNKGNIIISNGEVSCTGLAIPSPDNLSKLTVSLNDFENYWIIDTDYKNYALVYSCTTTPILNIRKENALILSRNKTLDKPTIDKLKAELPSLIYFFKTLQNCDK